MGFPCENSVSEFSIMTDIKQHEYDLLKEIGHDPMATQANLSTRLGIAVGSVKCYIKRFTQRAMAYAWDSLKVYGVYRKKAKTVAEQLQQKVINQVHIEGMMKQLISYV